MGYEIAWSELETALQNEEACSRYSRGYRKERKEEQKGIVRACSDLKAAMIKGKYYGTINNVCTI